jgi:6-pyruvoyltetrahydropterin/6-carboxytetrahydropterin synthase
MATAGEIDPVTGMVLNVKDLKKLLESQVLEPMDHKFLNQEVPEFRTRIPTTENLAIEIWNRISPRINFGRLHRVRLYETADLYVDYLGE